MFSNIYNFCQLFDYPKANYEPLSKRQPCSTDVNRFAVTNLTHGEQEPYNEVGPQSPIKHISGIQIGKNLPILRMKCYPTVLLSLCYTQYCIYFLIIISCISTQIKQDKKITIVSNDWYLELLDERQAVLGLPKFFGGNIIFCTLHAGIISQFCFIWSVSV